jgi:hypothetical protein
MPLQSQDSPLGAFLKALREEGIDCILIGAMAAVQHGAPILTVDYDFWVRLRERRYVKLLTIVHRLGGTIRAPTLYELSDGTQVNAIFRPSGLRSFGLEWKACRLSKLENVPVRVLPLARVIASKRAANRDKDQAVLPVLERTLRLAKRLKERPLVRSKAKRKPQRRRSPR